MNTVTLPASAVRDVLKAAVAFVGKDTTLPMLCAVQLDTIDGYLVATATNRYVVGRSRAKLTEGEWAGPFLMTMADAKRVLAAAKDAAAVMLPCTFSVDEGARTLSLHTEQATLNAAELDEEFPKVAHLLRTPPTGSTGHSAVTSEVLKPFMGLARDRYEKNMPIEFHFSPPNKIVLINFSDHFQGALMPYRMPEEREPFPRPWERGSGPHPDSAPDAPRPARHTRAGAR